MRWVALLFAVACVSACGARVGDPCRQKSACDGIDFGYCAKAGFCTRPCGATTPIEPLSGASVEQTQCPAGSTCARRGRRMVCLPTCASTKDCASGLECVGGVCELVQPFVPAPSR